MGLHPVTSIAAIFLLLLLVSAEATPLRRQKLTTWDASQIPDIYSNPSRGPPSPTLFFEVTRPIRLPPNATRCSTLVLRHDFAGTYGTPPVTAPYTPPSHCHSLQKNNPPSKIVLEWSAFCKGRQFDRIFGIWVGGVEVLRSCTAEPRPNGVVWTVEKDVTRYTSLFSRPQTVAVYLANIVDSTYTGVYHVNVTLHFYYGGGGGREKTGTGTRPGFGPPADLVLPISRTLPLNDGLWFLVENSTDVRSKKVSIPTNAYRAVLEIYVSFHSSDEFWYANPPNAYIDANNLTGTPGNGAFREVTVSLDGTVVGAIWPFTVIYTGGINPLLWRPISGIGSFNLPTYDIEITPSLWKMLDGKPHELGFGVTDALSVWFVDANLHLWVDGKRSRTVGGPIKHEAPAFVPSLDSKFTGLDGSFLTTASRRISSTGWVKSSHGKITTHFHQSLHFTNFMAFGSHGTRQLINQTIHSNVGLYAKSPSSILHSEQALHTFPLYLYTGIVPRRNGSSDIVANVSYAFRETRVGGGRPGFKMSTLVDKQEGQGDMLVEGNLVKRGVASTRQAYRFESTEGCYFRNVSSSNYTILGDISGELCGRGDDDYPLQRGSWDLFTWWLRSSARRISIESDLQAADHINLNLD